MRTRVLQVDLSAPLPDQSLGDGYGAALVLFRHRGRPLGTLRLRCPDGRLRGSDLLDAVEADPALRGRWSWAGLMDVLGAEDTPTAPKLTWSIVVCTRNRTDDLRRCLDSLVPLLADGGEIVIVDNAPSDDSTERLCARHPVIYVREERAGLNRARQRGAQVASGEIVLYTDDDVVVDAGWVRAMVEPFAEPRIAAATGLVLPLEQETEAQVLFERYGGFARGYKRRAVDLHVLPPAGGGSLGAGASMAFRRDLVLRLRLFHAELDAGTIARTGGDSYAIYLLLAAGYKVVYTPDAIAWHRHRRDFESLRRTLADYSVGGFVFLLRCLLQHRDPGAISVGARWFRDDHLRLLRRWVLRRRDRLPAPLVFAYLEGAVRAPLAYWRSRRAERTETAA